MRIVHVITGLAPGGAESMLCRLLKKGTEGAWEAAVVSLAPANQVAPVIRRLGIPLAEMRLSNAVQIPHRLAKLARLLRTMRPSIIQTWMYHANLMGGLAAAFTKTPVIWNLRRTKLENGVDRRQTLWTSRVCASVSSALPSHIVCCSSSAREWHIAAGYSSKAMTVIPNGFDTETFRPDPDAHLALCRELGLPSETQFVGIIARFDPSKDHRTFLRAAAKIHANNSRVRFILCGSGVTNQNRSLMSWIRDSQITNACYLLGHRADVARITASLDVIVSSSNNEGFPNSVGEGMACAIPCVATDVGETAELLGITGCLIKPGDPNQLAEACNELLRASPEKALQAGLAERQRIVDHFGIDSVFERYQTLYSGVLARCAE